MADYQSRNRPFDYDPPKRRGPASGVLVLIGVFVLLFLLAMVFFGGGTGSLPEEGNSPAAVTPSDAAPVAPAVQE